MPCPFRHEGDVEPEIDPEVPWIRRWYERDINISRRVGWSGVLHDAFVYPFKELDHALQQIFPKEKLDGMDAGARMRAVLSEFVRSGGVYPPSDAKGDAGAGVDSVERPFQAFWPPVADKTFPGLYPPMDAMGEGGDQRPHQMFWAESALTEVVKPETGYGTVMPGGTPSGLPRTAEGGTMGGGYGGYSFMAETFQKMKELISPQVGFAGIPAFRQADPEL